MGCCGNSNLTYKHKGIEHRVTSEQMVIIRKWGLGALARRRFKKLTQAQAIAGLRKPMYVDGKLILTDEYLMTQDDLAYQLSSDGGGRQLYWDTKFKEISSNRKYSGQWGLTKKNEDDERFTGLGTIIYPDGSKFQGMTNKGKFHGKGVFLDKQGCMYDGEWFEDQYHGHGEEHWDYGKIKYVGDFIEGQKTGKGKFEFDGNWYEGQFVEGQFHGKGTYYFAESQKTYTGDFTNNTMQGRGKMEWPDKSFYVGRFQNGMMNGSGKLTYENGDTYDGEWVNDQRHGQGDYYNAKLDRERTSQWENDAELDPPSDANVGQSAWQLMRGSKPVQNLPGIKKGGLAGRKKGAPPASKAAAQKAGAKKTKMPANQQIVSRSGSQISGFSVRSGGSMNMFESAGGKRSAQKKNPLRKAQVVKQKKRPKPQQDVDQQIRSKAGDTEITVKFKNNCDFGISYHWYDYEGKMEPYGGMAERCSEDMSTYVTHAWGFTNTDTGEQVQVNGKSVFVAREEHNGKVINIGKKRTPPRSKQPRPPRQRQPFVDEESASCIYFFNNEPKKIEEEDYATNRDNFENLGEAFSKILIQNRRIVDKFGDDEEIGQCIEMAREEGFVKANKKARRMYERDHQINEGELDDSEGEGMAGAGTALAVGLVVGGVALGAWAYLQSWESEEESEDEEEEEEEDEEAEQEEEEPIEEEEEPVEEEEEPVEEEEEPVEEEEEPVEEEEEPVEEEEEPVEEEEEPVEEEDILIAEEEEPIEEEEQEAEEEPMEEEEEEEPMVDQDDGGFDENAGGEEY